MRKIVSLILIIAGTLFISLFLYEFYHNKMSAQQALEEAQQLVSKKDHDVDEKSQFTPQIDEVIGMLHIPKLEEKLPIIEGTDEEMLEKGVGHYSSTAFPGELEQILLSGHRDTVFRRFDELEIGDRFLVEMPYGTFEYEMRKTDIVDANNTTVIRPMGEEVLTLSTCYPFGYLGAAPNRYIIYAYPV